MDNTAIINYDNNFSFFNEFLFSIGKINEKKIIKSIKILNEDIKVINFPATPVTLLNKRKLNIILSKFCDFLKKRNIERLLISDEADKILSMTEYLSEKFYIFKGKKIINTKFDYILNKSLNIKKSDEISVYSNNLNFFYEHLESILNKFREISIITSYKNMFVSFTDEIFNNYGININVYSNNEYIADKNNFIINVDTEYKSHFDLDLKTLKINFIKNSIFESLNYLFKEFDERVLEFIIFNVYGNAEKSIITEFCNKYNIRIVKLYKK